MAKKKSQSKLQLRDPNAKAMWGRTKSQVFADKTKYKRHAKHRNKEV